MNEHYIDGLFKKLRALDDTGTRQLDNGTLLISENQQRKPWQLAYRHILYGPLNDEQIACLEVRIERKLPAALRDLYRHSNGGVLFLESFSWQGLREDYSRELGKWLPVGLERANTIERPLEGPPGQERYADNSNQVCFGIYVEFAAEVMMRLDGDPKVYAVPRCRLGPVLHEWSDLETFFVSEVDRMIALCQARMGTVSAANPLPPLWLEQDP